MKQSRLGTFVAYAMIIALFAVAMLALGKLAMWIVGL